MQTIRRGKQVVERGLPIVDVEELSIYDYPGKLCATLATPGCNFRCPYCLKEELILNFIPMKKYPENDVIKLLHPRVGFLDGVCVTGGEPTIHQGLPSFLYRLKSIGCLVKLDTNGSHPERLGFIMRRRLVDYIALDIKVPLGRYRDTVKHKITPDIIMNSVQLIRRSGVDHEFRTTVVPGLVDGGDLEEIAQSLKGSKRYVLNRFKPGRTLSPECRDVEPYSSEEMKQFRDRVTPYFGEVILRM